MCVYLCVRSSGGRSYLHSMMCHDGEIGKSDFRVAAVRLQLVHGAFPAVPDFGLDSFFKGRVPLYFCTVATKGHSSGSGLGS